MKSDEELNLFDKRIADIGRDSQFFKMVYNEEICKSIDILRACMRNHNLKEEIDERCRL